MAEDRSGQTAVMFISERTGDDPEGYAEAAARMDALAAQQPGYLGVDHVGDPNGHAITISYWADPWSARDWRSNEEHRQARNAGRGRWYKSYMLHVAEIGRSYSWERP